MVPPNNWRGKRPFFFNLLLRRGSPSGVLPVVSGAVLSCSVDDVVLFRGRCCIVSWAMSWHDGASRSLGSIVGRSLLCDEAAVAFPRSDAVGREKAHGGVVFGLSGGCADGRRLGVSCSWSERLGVCFGKRWAIDRRGAYTLPPKCLHFAAEVFALCQPIAHTLPTKCLRFAARVFALCRLKPFVWCKE